MFLVYKNHEIISNKDDNFRIKKPNNKYFQEVAASVSTAKKWIDAVEVKTVITKEINIPFEGYYNSNYDAIIDDVIELDETDVAIKHGYDYQVHGDVETFIKENNINVDSELHEDDRDIDFCAMKEDLNKIYIDEFLETFNEYTGLKIELKYKTMESPKEYNFETDRIFCEISEQHIKELYEHATGNPLSFNEAITERFTSCSGFISSYSNVMQEWLQKSVADYDHNELATLLIASIKQEVSEDDFNNEVLEKVLERARSNGEIDTILIKTG